MSFTSTEKVFFNIYEVKFTLEKNFSYSLLPSVQALLHVRPPSNYRSRGRLV